MGFKVAEVGIDPMAAVGWDKETLPPFCDVQLGAVAGPLGPSEVYSGLKVEVFLILSWERRGSEPGRKIIRVEAKGDSVVCCTPGRGFSIYGAFFFFWQHVSLGSFSSFFPFRSLIKTEPLEPY